MRKQVSQVTAGGWHWRLKGLKVKLNIINNTKNNYPLLINIKIHRTIKIIKNTPFYALSISYNNNDIYSNNNIIAWQSQQKLL